MQHDPVEDDGEDILLTAEESAAYLGIEIETLDRLTRTGVLPSVPMYRAGNVWSVWHQYKDCWCASRHSRMAK